MPLSGEEPHITIAGKTAQLSFCGRAGVRVQVCVSAPNAEVKSEEELERHVLKEAAGALQSALQQIRRSERHAVKIDDQLQA